MSSKQDVLDAIALAAEHSAPITLVFSQDGFNGIAALRSMLAVPELLVMNQAVFRSLAADLHEREWRETPSRTVQVQVGRKLDTAWRDHFAANMATCCDMVYV